MAEEMDVENEKISNTEDLVTLSQIGSWYNYSHAELI